jgi:hypothetical protein
MVIQRTIESLKERPHEERRAVALSISIGVMAVLFIGWSVFFFRTQNIAQVQQVPDAYKDAVANVQEAYNQSQTGWVSEATNDSEVRTQPIVPQENATSDTSGIQFIEEASSATDSTLP